MRVRGVGKSTLLRVLAGAERPDRGTVAVPADLAHLAQDPVFPEGASVGGVLDLALAPLHAMVARLEALAGHLDRPDAADEYAALLDRATLHAAWDAERRAEVAAARLGLDRLDRRQPVATLSGGQRMRLALAALVARRPECVLLDEPTNHLDDGAVSFLEEYLRDLPGVVVVATHDRTFLENVCTTIVDLDPMHLGLDGAGGRRFSGGYSAYLRAKTDSRRRWVEAYVAHQEELDDLRRAARTTARAVAPHNRPPRDGDKFIPYAKGQKVARAVSRRVRDVERRIEVLEAERVPRPPRPISFRGSVTSGRGARVAGRDLVVPGRLTLARLDLRPGEHLLVTGTNGSGKSTLLQVLAGELAAQGHLDVGARRIGHLPQEVRFARPDRSALEMYDALAGVAVPLVDLGLLHPRDLGRPVGLLSTGQQRRVVLALLIARRPDLLLLDEPTNHISLSLAEEMEEALQHAAGSVVVASHDRWLRGGWRGPVLGL